MSDADPFDLDRFVTAQAGVHEQALAELVNGRKLSHWMWFVFPQLRDLGRSSTAHRYGIAGLDEARAYLAHPVLGPRLAACTDAVLPHRRHTAQRIFGIVDALKFRSSMTLFDVASDGTQARFRTALDVFYEGEPDATTLRLVGH